MVEAVTWAERQEWSIPAVQELTRLQGRGSDGPSQPCKRTPDSTAEEGTVHLSRASIHQIVRPKKEMSISAVPLVHLVANCMMSAAALQRDMLPMALVVQETHTKVKRKKSAEIMRESHFYCGIGWS